MNQTRAYDYKLLDRILGHDPAAAQDAWTELVRTHRPVMLAYARQLLRNKADADDIVQYTFVKAYEHLPRFYRNASVKTWLMHIVHNSSFNLMRDRKRRRQLLEQAAEVGFVPGMVEYISADDIIEANERARLLQEALLQLTQDHCTIIVLRECEGLSYEEIAQRLKVKIGTVMSRLSRARARLRVIAPNYVSIDGR